MNTKTDLLPESSAFWHPKQIGRYQTTPESKKMLFKRVFDGVATRNQAIKAQCLECQGFDLDSITGCSSPACSLFRFRPYQKRKK